MSEPKDINPREFLKRLGIGSATTTPPCRAVT